MKRYKEYKDSGVDWIGEIPSHWESKKIKYLVSNERNAIKPGPFGSDLKSSDIISSGIKVYTQQNVIKKDSDLGDDFISTKKFSELKNFLAKEGDFLLSTRGTIGKVYELPSNCEDGIIHPCLIKFRIDKTLVTSKIIDYVFNGCDIIQNQIRYMSNSTIIDVIYSDTLKNLSFPVCSIEEQNQIVKYLDKKTSQIETLINKKEELIETLKSSRTKLISETVTKGLDKDVPMKDSGVDWIGEIPSNWEIKNLGYIASMIVPMRDKPTSFDGDIPWIRIEDFDGKYIEKSKTEQNVSKRLIKKMNLKIYPKGTVLCSCSCNMGETAIVSKPIISNQTFIGIVPGSKLISEYLYYLMISNKKRLDFLSSGAIQQYLSRTEFEHLKVQIPSIEEQMRIYKYLDEKTSQIDTLVLAIEEQIELLKKAKQKLITEVVTGKIDVTNL
ncbi:restriction endonuclease subunit S [Bacillus sp. BAU-SS-2023]|nr:restriction endonuclease subunit S [Bacillus sp. BAU-SS-2023]